MKQATKKLVALSGSFDVLHAGHVRYLQAARRLGDALVVFLNSDTSVRLYKGPGRPIVPQADRMAMLSALSCVDRVVIFDELTPISVLKKVKPDIYCNAADWGSGFVESEIVASYGGVIKLLPYMRRYSTSALFEKIANRPFAPSAVFLDRDGTVNSNKDGYVHLKEDFVFLPGVLEALKKLSLSHYKIIMLTNQSGIARGYYARHDIEKLHRWVVTELKKSEVRIDAIYYCPHGPEEGCECRKPGVGMMLQAARDFGLDLSKSWMVGDSDIDVRMGRSANVKTIKIGAKIQGRIQPNYYVKNLAKAVGIIL